jgi:hypothetical protein
MAFHDGKPVEFLHRVRFNRDGHEIWRVRPIFTETVDAPERDEVYRHGDRLTPIHSKSQ